MIIYKNIKGYFCKFFKEFIIIDIDIKFVGLNKYTLEIHNENCYSLYLNYYILLAAHLKQKNKEYLDSVWL